MSTDTDLAQRTSVQGVMNYLAEESRVLRRFTAPGESVNTGVYDEYQLPVHNGRPEQDSFDLDVNGFELITYPSAVTDFTDKEQLDQIYRPEVEAFVKQRTGADEVALLGWTLRRSENPKENDSQPAAGLVHVDISPEGAQDHARYMYDKHFPDGKGYSRALSTSFWRVFSPPPQDWPLAVCDFQSLDEAEGLPNTLYFVDEIPADLFGPVLNSKRQLSGSEFHYRATHKWYYFPDMTRDEVLFFKLNDSDHSAAWRVMHSAFYDATAQATEPRHSVEFRTLAFFH